MWKDDLEKIKSKKSIYGEKINLGVTEKELIKFKKQVKERLNIELPNQYLKMLSIFNGLEFNGFIVYGIDEEILEVNPNESITGLIDSNELLYDNIEQKQYIFLGESDISWYVYDLKNNCYSELDNPSGTVCYKFNTFPELLNKMFIDALL